MKIKSIFLLSALLLSALSGANAATGSTMARSSAMSTNTAQMEQLGRGLVVEAGQSGGRFLSWRLLGTDPVNITFDVIRNGSVIARNLKKGTCYQDNSGKTTDRYQVVAHINGEDETSDAIQSWSDLYTSTLLSRPEGGTTSSGAYSYSPNDCSVGDVDGDGEYELFVKWDPTNSSDNAGGSFTGNCIIDCYKISGSSQTESNLLWRVNLGKNIRSGAHYTQFLVYDFNGDGYAELICKTAPGSVDGTGQFVTAAATDSNIKSANNQTSYVNSSGMILSGPEYLTVFDGQTGAAIHTIWYNPNRAGNYGRADNHPTDKNFWGDANGNRGDRFLAAVAHLDKDKRQASAVFCRGYYARAYLWAVNFDGATLSHRWLHCSSSASAYSVTDANNKTTNYSGLKPTSGGGSGTMYGNGNHNISVADVDGDGCDEIIWGSAACDHNGRLLYGVGFGHGDAMHLADLMPDRPGLEVFDVHEDKKQTYCWDIHDAATGAVLLKGGPSGVDNGRGIAAQVDANVRGCYFNSSAVPQTLSCLTGDTVSQYGPTIQNFRIYWDGDLQEEYQGDISRHNSPFLEKWNGNGCTRMYPKRNTNLYSIGNSMTCNGTKGTPCLQADIFGDWREEMIFFDGSDSTHVNIFSTNIPTDHRVATLMHDHTYRMGICWQNVSYNQPPHLGWYMPDYAERFVWQEAPIVEPQPEEEGVDTIFVQDYEQVADASSWQFTKTVSRGDLTLENVNDEHGNYIQYYLPSGVNSTPVYTLISSGDYDTYTLEFDAAFSSGNKDGGEFVVATEGGNMEVPQRDVWFNYSAYNQGLHTLMRLNMAANSSSMTINGDDTNTAELATGQWFRYKLEVNGESRTVNYTITSKATGAKFKEGTLQLPEGTTSTRLQGFYFLNPRYLGRGCFDNICITVEKPKIEPGDVNGDGSIDFDDIIETLNIISNGQTAKTADVNGDGRVDIADLLLMLKKRK